MTPDQAVSTAQTTAPGWASTPPEQRAGALASVAAALRGPAMNWSPSPTRKPTSERPP